MSSEEHQPTNRERSSIDYILRTSQQSLTQMSSMADQKANIVLGASLIMITIIVTIASSSGITASMATLGGFAVGSSITALLAVLPSTGANPHDQPNPLYFGDIAYMTAEQHQEALRQLVDREADVYETIAYDIHQHSRTLQFGKFRYLRYSYVLFIVGLLATTVVIIAEWATDAI